MKYKTYNSEIQYLIKTVKDASKLISNHKFEVYEKHPDDYVTSLDIEVEKFILKRLKERFPNHTPISEEFNSDGKVAENSYTIDPIDGTINFINHLPCWSVQVALKTAGKFIASVVYFPTENELFTATLGGGAYLNGKPICVKKTGEKQTVYNFSTAHNKEVVEAAFLSEIKEISRHTRMFGSQSAAFCDVACGRLGATIFGDYNLWDIEPGRLIASEAGASFADHEGNYIIAASSEKLASKFDAVTRKYLIKK